MSLKEGKSDRDKSFPERLKRFLKSEKTTKCLPEVRITEEVRIGLDSSSSYEVRLRTIQELGEIVQTKKLQDSSIDKIWHQVKDLVSINNPAEIRHAVFSLFSTVCETCDRLGYHRLLFMKVIMDNYLMEDTLPLFNFFQCVVHDGRDIEYIEEDLGPFLVKWSPLVFSSSPSAVPIINLTTNLFKFNAAHFDDDIIQQLVLLHINQLYQSKSREELEAHFRFMDTLIAYVYIPSGTLTHFISALARLVSIPFVVEDSWKVMRNLLRTELGNSALCSLTELIETSDNFHIIRGSIYFITCALWSKQKLTSLSIGPMAILPTLHKASESLHPLIILETAVSISKLVNVQSVDLHFPSWELLLDILERLFYFTVNFSNKDQAQMIFDVLNGTLDEIEDRIEEGQFRGTLSKFYSLVERYSKQRNIESVHMSLNYKIRALHCGQSRWLTHLTSLIHRHFREELRPSIRLQALAKLRYIFDKYRGTVHAENICKSVVVSQLDEIQNDPEMVVRKAAVSLLIHMIIHLQVPVVETLLKFIEKVVLSPYSVTSLANPPSYVESEVDDIYEGIQGLILIFKKKIWCLPSSYAIQAYQILTSVLEFHYRNLRVLERVSSIRKLIFEMIFEMRADADYHLGLPNCPEAQLPIGDDDPPEMRDLLPKYSPYIVVDHKYGQKQYTAVVHNEDSLNSSYDVDQERESAANSPRKDAGDLSSGDRASFVEETNDSSPLFRKSVSQSQYESPKSPKSDVSVPLNEPSVEDIRLDWQEPKTVITHLSLTKAAMIVIVAMKKEKDWNLLKMILERIPQVLQNKALILSRDGNDIDYLATTLCDLISSEELKIPDSLHNTPSKFSKSDFDAYVYPVMATLSSYHQHLDTLYQKNIIQCLQNGMSSKSAPQCVSALTLCILEMRNTMTKLLREIMIQLSKISATVQNGQPTLEFLSTLLHLPRVYSDFLPSQYLTVFAISIPYTNPFKFNHYIVTLAYHVICMWFMKCRIPHRRGFVHFIAKNLNMILLNEETASRMKPVVTNDQLLEAVRERATRLRSFSTRRFSRMELVEFDVNESTASNFPLKGDIDMIQFHRDLRETCVDFMARNCFDTLAPETIRSPVSQLLFNEGQQQRWLVGTRIITVTTSGCSKKPIKHGLCHKCLQFCIPEGTLKNLDTPTSQADIGLSRRRHKSEYHRSVSRELKVQPHSKDDSHMGAPITQFPESGVFSGEKIKNEFGDSMGAGSKVNKQHICCCWCSRWAEITVRQPTGNVSYAMRVLNPQTHIAKEDLVPVQDLSSFYSTFSENAETDILDPDPIMSSCGSGVSPNRSRQRAFSGDSGRMQELEAGSFGVADEWSHSVSDSSSGIPSLASSETKLHAKSELEMTAIGSRNSPVQHCLSNPEVSKVLSEDSGMQEQKQSQVKAGHHPLAHSVSLMEERMRNVSNQAKRMSDPPSSTSIAELKTKIRNSVVRCNSVVGSSSTEQNNRTRHSSAMQTAGTTSSSVYETEEDSSLEPMKRGRGYTISDMNPASRVRVQRPAADRRPTLAFSENLNRNLAASTASVSSLPSDGIVSSKSSSSISRCSKEAKGGVSPSSVFLQLYYQGCFGVSCFRPIFLPSQNPEIERTIKLFDRIKPHEHHRIGVIYVGPNQRTEAEIFGNTTGSDRYHQFLDGIGTVYDLKDFTEHANLGGLDKRGSDGKLIHMWQDDMMQVLFHVATSMPNKESDPNGNDKKRHIGNDYVTIVYNNSGHPFEFKTIKSQVNHSAVEIVPGDHNTNSIQLLTKPDLKEFVSWNNSDFLRLVSDSSLPLLGRQLALHANLASIVWESLKRSQCRPYATNWMERLHKVRKLRESVLGKSLADKHMAEMQELQHSAHDPSDLSYLDFADMIDIDKSAEVKDVKDRSRLAGFLNLR